MKHFETCSRLPWPSVQQLATPALFFVHRWFAQTTLGLECFALAAAGAAVAPAASASTQDVPAQTRAIERNKKTSVVRHAGARPSCADFPAGSLTSGGGGRALERAVLTALQEQLPRRGGLRYVSPPP